MSQRPIRISWETLYGKGATARPPNFRSHCSSSCHFYGQKQARESFKIPAMKRYKCHLGSCRVWSLYPLNILDVKNFWKSFGRQVTLGRRVASLSYFIYTYVSTVFHEKYCTSFLQYTCNLLKVRLTSPAWYHKIPYKV
jgi:hypothetical protein